LNGLRLVLYLGLAAVTAATLLTRLSWSWLPAELASHFRVQYFWTCLLAALVIAATGRRRIAALALIPAALNLAVILPLYWPSDANSPGSGAELRLASINVYSGNRRHDSVLAFIRETKPDVVLLMEMTDAWRDLLADLAADYPHQQSALRGDNFGIALVSRLPLEDPRVLELGDAEIPTIVTRLEWEGEKLLLIGTHPLPPGSRGYWQLRNEQFAALAKLCAEETGPVVVLGDLNSTSWSAHFFTLLDGTRLRDSRQGFGVQPSWPAWSPLVRIPIDHCLVSPEIAVRGRFIGRDVGSDHYPVVVDVAINSSAADRSEDGAAEGQH
jgi:endonuclease/exonuclease/phosphatase (EEP) superfamily protein YafD